MEASQAPQFDLQGSRGSKMSFRAPPSASSAKELYKICVQTYEQEVPDSHTTSSMIKVFSTVTLPISHPVFSAEPVQVFAPFSHRSGGIPLRTLSSNETTALVAHAEGDDLDAEQFEVIWQFKLFAQGTCSTFSETTKADILTLGGTEEAPRRIIGEYTGEEHYLGWKEEHFKKFFKEYTRSKVLQGIDLPKFQMPKRLSAAELSALSGPSVSALDRSLQDSISAGEKEPSQANKKVAVSKNNADKTHVRQFPRSTGIQSRPIGVRRGQSSMKDNLKRSSAKKPSLAIRPKNIYSKKAWYYGNNARGHRKDRDSRNQKRSILPASHITLNKCSSSPKPITSLRDTESLGPAVSKTVKPFRCISAQFRDKNSFGAKAPLTQPVRDFIARKTEEQMLNPAQKDAVLHIIRTVSPKVFHQLRLGRLIDYHNLSDELYRQLARLISDISKSAAGTATASTKHDSNPSMAGINTTTETSSAQILTPEMVRFTRENILKLSPEHQQALALIMERTVASVDVLPGWVEHVLQPEDLPVENQIVIWRYLKMHLPEEELGMEGREWEESNGVVGKGGGTDGMGGVVDDDDFELDLSVGLDTDMDVDIGMD